MPSLHPFQVESVDWLQTRTDGWILHETGLGKSVVANELARRKGWQSVLVICPALVRLSWFKRFEEWYPELCDNVKCITMGRGRAALSRPALARLAAMYASPTQICSADLLRQLPEEQHRYDLIVLDEMHEHVSFRSNVSRELRRIFKQNPKAFKLGLSATLIASEPKSAWNLLSLFWPGMWGKARPNGDPPWAFLHRYCLRKENEYGVSYYGLNPDHADEFRAIIATVSRRTLRSEVAHLLPPLDLQPLLTDSSKSDAKLVSEWASTATKESEHTCVLSYMRASAKELFNEVRPMCEARGIMVAHLDGSVSTATREKVLSSLRSSQRSLLVGTLDSLSVGISLSYVGQYLITEPPPTLAKLVQAMGRFVRLDSRSPALGKILLREGKDDSLVKTLKRRISDFNALVVAGQGEHVLQQAVTAFDCEKSFDLWLGELVNNYRGDVADADEEED